MSRAEEIATKAFFGTLTRWGTIRTFRRVAELGLTHATPALLAENLAFAKKIRDDPAMDRWIRDKEEYIRESGGPEKVAETLTGAQKETFQAAVDAVSLIYAHSLIDAAALDYLRVCGVVAPSDYMQFVGDRKVSLNDVGSTTFEAIRASKLEEFLAAIERESLIKKVDKLFALCKPPAGFSIDNYTYDQDRLDGLDDKRHDLVHGAGPVAPLPSIKEVSVRPSQGGPFRARPDLRQCDPRPAASGARCWGVMA